MAFPTGLKTVGLDNDVLRPQLARGRFLLTKLYVYGLVGVVVEVRDEWAVRGRRLRTMACVATTMSRYKRQGSNRITKIG
jgi:hypothetical protein